MTDNFEEYNIWRVGVQLITEKHGTRSFSFLVVAEFLQDAIATAENRLATSAEMHWQAVGVERRKIALVEELGVAYELVDEWDSLYEKLGADA